MSAPCYSFDGRLYDPHPADGGHTIPCNQTAVENGQHSACCRPNDLCMTNGLCLNPDDRRAGKNHYWREGCTDPTFQDPACPKHCKDVNYPGPSGMNAYINFCLKSEPWCCAYTGGLIGDWPLNNAVNTTCCTIKGLMFTAPNPTISATARLQVQQDTPQSSNDNGVAITSYATSEISSAVTSMQSTPSPGRRSNSSLRVGLGVGLSLGVFLIIALGVILYLLRRRHVKDSLYNGGHYDPTLGHKSRPSEYYETSGTPMVELDGSVLPEELHSEERRKRSG